LTLTTGTGFPYDTGNGPQDPTVNAGVSTGVQIGNIYSTVANLKQARLNESGSEQNLIRSRQTVVFTVMSNFLSLIAAQEQVAVQEKNLASVQAQQKQIEAYVKAGARPISDLYQQQATTASAQLSVVQSHRSIILARMNLIRTLQLDPFGEYDFVVPELAPLSTSFSSLDLTTISQKALSQRPDLLASQIALSSAEQGLKIASATRWPSVSLQLGYNTGNFNSGLDGDLFDQLDQGRRGTLSINVSVPILDFTYGITKERAQIALDNARISLENTRQAVTTDVRTAYLDLQLAEQQLAVAEAQVQAADLALQTAQQRYDVGAATLVELTQAQLAQVRAASTLVNARYELVFQSRLMDYYLGQLQTD
jgi:outer membrane protein